MVTFRAKDDDAYYLAWTTTPWTLPSNLALCVNPDVDYVKVRVNGKNYILAEALVDKVFEDAPGDREIVERYKGKDLEYREYEPLYPFANAAVAKQPNKKAFIVTCDGYVTTEDGTGIVHMAPAFGEDDNRVCQKYGVAFVNLVNGKGELTEEKIGRAHV